MAKQFEIGSEPMVKALRVVDGLDNKLEYIKMVLGKLTPKQYTSLHRELRMGSFVSMNSTPKYGETLKLTKVLRPAVKQGFNPINPLGISYAVTPTDTKQDTAKVNVNSNDASYSGTGTAPTKINVHVMSQDQTTPEIFEKRDMVGLLDASVAGSTLGILDIRMSQHLNAIEDDLMRKLVWQIDGKVPSNITQPDGSPLDKWWSYDVQDTNKVELDLEAISNRDLFLLFVDGVTSFLKIRDNFTLKITKKDIISLQGEEIKKRLILGEKEALVGGSIMSDTVYNKINAGELTRDQIWGVKILTDNVMDVENANSGVETLMTIQLREASMIFEEIMETYFGKVSIANNLDYAFYIRYAFGGENIYPEYILKYVLPAEAPAGEEAKPREAVVGLGNIVKAGMKALKDSKEAKELEKANKKTSETLQLVEAIASITKANDNGEAEKLREELAKREEEIKKLKAKKGATTAPAETKEEVQEEIVEETITQE